MPSVKVREGENFERALRRFTKACQKAGVFSDYRKHQENFRKRTKFNLEATASGDRPAGANECDRLPGHLHCCN